jgi:methionyl-tRNA formyltransferase
VKALRTVLTEGSGEPGTLLDPTGIIACGDGAVRLLQGQRPGRGVITGEEFLRGARLAPGARLG